MAVELLNLLTCSWYYHTYYHTVALSKLWTAYPGFEDGSCWPTDIVLHDKARQNKRGLTLDLSNLGGQQAKVVRGTTVHSQQVACSEMSQCL